MSAGSVTCGACRHEFHGDVCHNFQSDADCECTSKGVALIRESPSKYDSWYDGEGYYFLDETECFVGPWATYQEAVDISVKYVAWLTYGDKPRESL